MSDELQKLALELVACEQWRWMAGMRWIEFNEYATEGRYEDEGDAAYATECQRRTPDDEAPDLTDHATVGCLLAMADDALGWAACVKMDSKGDWGVWRAIPGYRAVEPCIHGTRGEAIARALLHAWSTP